MGLEKIYGDFINGTMLLEKCFNFHIPIRWHLMSYLVGQRLKMVVSAVPRALTHIWSFSSEARFALGEANPQHERRGFGWGLEGWRRLKAAAAPLGQSFLCRRENEWLTMLRIELPIVLCRLMCLHERFPFCSFFKLLLNQNHVVLLCQPFHSSKFYFYYLSECVESNLQVFYRLLRF